MKTMRVLLEGFAADPDQPRKIFVEGEIEALSEDLRRRGQLVPLIVFTHAGKAVIVDGERRWRAAKLAGLTELIAIVLPERPTTAQLALIRNSLDAHRLSLNPVERSNLLTKIQMETGWTVGEMAEQLSIKQSLLSKLLSYQKLAPEIQGLLATGGLCMERAFIISSVQDHAAQLEMVKQYAHLSRESIRAKIKGNGKPDVKTKRATFVLPGDYSVTFKGPDATIEEVIEQLNETVKQLRRAASQGHDVVSAVRVMSEKAKVNDAE